MRREFNRLGENSFDLLVIGGGIYGAWTAYDAALRGLKVALVEQNDWGSGTSQSSSKLIHGGLRYLEYFKLGLVRRALSERRRLAKLAPHRVYPLKFMVPLYRGDRIGKLRLEAGLWLYDRLAGGGQPVPPHASYNRKETLEKFDFLTSKDLKCAFSYGDCGTDDARFTLEIVAGAMAAGAVAVNHARAHLSSHNGVIMGARVSDRGNGSRGEVKVNARVTVNCAGPWAPQLAGMPKSAQRMVRQVKGVHLLMPPLPCDEAFLLTARSDGRVFFVIPWYGHALVGTTDEDYLGDPSDVAVTESDIDYLLTAVNRSLGGVNWTRDDIKGSYAGVRTLRAGEQDNPKDVTREWSLEAPQPGLIMPVGGKFTSSRAEAAITVDRVLTCMERAPGPCPTKRRPFPWRPAGQFDDWLKFTTETGEALGLDRETARFLAMRHGSRVQEVHDILSRQPGLVPRVVADAPFCWAEVVHAARSEMALTLDDILRRRLPVAILSSLDTDMLVRAAELAGNELGWDRIRQGQEVEAMLNRYGQPQLRP